MIRLQHATSWLTVTLSKYEAFGSSRPQFSLFQFDPRIQCLLVTSPTCNLHNEVKWHCFAEARNISDKLSVTEIHISVGIPQP
jgi:hypothetical protein